VGIKHKLVIAAAASALAASSHAAPGDLGYELTPAQVEALGVRSNLRQELDSPVGRILVLTRDYGSGLELREAYVYRWSGPAWELAAWLRTNSSKVQGRVKGNHLELMSKAGKVLITIPLEALVASFDPHEH
jgi:hypothetical protein